MGTTERKLNAGIRTWRTGRSLAREPKKTILSSCDEIEGVKRSHVISRGILKSGGTPLENDGPELSSHDGATKGDCEA